MTRKGKRGQRSDNTGLIGDFKKDIDADRRYKSPMKGALAKDLGIHKKPKKNKS